ncbi:Zinc finger C2H2-type, partial [Cinara cedri]
IGQDVEEEQKPLILATVNSQEIGPIRIIPSPIVLDELSSTATIDQDVHEEQTHSTSATVNSKDMEPIRVISLLKVRDDLFSTANTVYQKNYLKTFKEFGAKAIRSQQILNDMTTIPKLFTLFKCMDKSCTDVFSDKVMFELHIQSHFSNMGKNKKNQINNSEQFKHCVYCFKQFDDGESLATHILKNYSFCKYFCPFCFYRAYTPLHVLFHQNLFHNTKNSKVIQLENDNSEEILMAVDYNDFIMPYKCNVGLCTFSCYVPNDFIHHLNKKHPQCDKLCCHICGYQDYSKGLIAYNPSLLIEHFKDHHLNMYQCIFCLFGTETMDSMISHLAMEHFEYDSLCLERSVKSGSCDSSKVGNLNIIRMEALLYNDLLKMVNLPSGMISLSENLTERTHIKQSNNAITKSKNSANIEGNKQSSPAEVLQASEKVMEMSNSIELVNYNQMNILKDNQNHLQKKEIVDPQESAKLQTVAENKNMISFSPDTIDNIPMTEFFPSVMGCSLCPNYTTRVRSILIRHLKAHQRNRGNTTKVIVNPVTSIGKSGHMFEKTTTQSASSVKRINTEKVEQAEVQQHPLALKLNKQNAKENVIVDGSSIDIKKKSMVKTESAKLQTVAKNKNMISFSPNTIANIPKTEFFPSPMACSLCLKFTTRVRYILIRHLKAHQRNRDNTTKEIVNPLTTIRTSVNMCEKPTTQSASSCESIIPEKVERGVVQQPPIPLELNKQNAKENVIVDGRSVAIKNKSTVKTESAKLQTAAENKNMISFSPDTINNIPMTEFFPSPIGCPLCPTFSTRVRSTLNRHLETHKRNRDNITKEIVSPLTTIRTSVKMCENPTTQSASSCESMNPEKVERGVVQQPSIPLELNKQNAKENVIVDGRS